MRRITVSASIALALLLIFVIPVLAQDGCEIIKSLPGGTILWCPNQVEPVPTSTPEPTATATATTVPEQPTATPVPPTPTAIATATETPHVHPTAAPTATSVPGATPIAMRPDAPMCAPEIHDVNRWHNVWNSERGCYYNHTHGDDPALANSIFGPIEQYWGSWLPVWGKDFEHHMGEQHAGWIVEVNLNLPRNRCAAGTDCIVASRTVSHHGPTGAKRGVHTAWVEYQILHADGTTSIMRTGFAWVVALLMSPYKQDVIQADIPLESLVQWQVLPGYGYARRQPDSADPYRAHVTCSDGQYGFAMQWTDPRNKRAEVPGDGIFPQRFWIMDDDNPTADGGRLYGMSPFVEFAQFVSDSSNCVEGTHTGIIREAFAEQYDPVRCPLLQRRDTNGNMQPVLGCRFNNSSTHLFSAEVDAGYRTAWLDNSNIDADKRRGWLDVSAWTVPQILNPDGSIILGRPDPRRIFTDAINCTQAGPTCVPFRYKGRATFAGWETPGNTGPWRTTNWDAGYRPDGTVIPGYENTWVLLGR